MVIKMARKYAVLDVNGPLTDEQDVRGRMGRYFQSHYAAHYRDQEMRDYLAGMLQMDASQRRQHPKYMKAVGAVVGSGFERGQLKLSPYPAAVTAVRKLKAGGVTPVIFSDMPGYKGAARALGMQQLIRECLGPDFGSKTDPTTFRKLLQRYGRDMAFFTDDGREAAAARAAQVRAFEVGNGDALLSAVNKWLE
jgi:methionine salvage enolase-phosphatase E1